MLLFDEMLLATDEEARALPLSRRQLQVFIDHANTVTLRIGKLEESHQSHGAAVALSKTGAAELMKALQKGIASLDDA